MMKSYATIDSIEGKYAVCELELVDTENSLQLSFIDKDTVMLDITLETITSIIGDVIEGDVLVLEHEDGKLQNVCYKDDAEKFRRVELLKAMQQK